MHGYSMEHMRPLRSPACYHFCMAGAQESQTGYTASPGSQW